VKTLEVIVSVVDKKMVVWVSFHNGVRSYLLLLEKELCKFLLMTFIFHLTISIMFKSPETLMPIS